MKSRINTIACTAFAVASLGAGFANAANTLYAPGDLVLFIQQEGGSNTIYANIGNSATVFRGAAAGADAGSSLNILDLSTTLTSAFGAGWASDPTIYVGLAGVWGTSATNGTLQNGDPQRTLYVSQARNSLGDIYTQNSAGYTVNTNTGMTTAANDIYAMNQAFENNYEGTITIAPVGTSLIDDYNPFLAPGIQDTAFEVFGGGVQQAGTAGDLGSLTSEGLGTIEYALDVYRILGRNNVAGQVDGVVREGSFEGSVVLGSNGQVSFLAIPEPSSVALIGLACGAFLVRRRRSA